MSFYDFQDRWVGARDALGNESQLVHDSINRKASFFDRTGAASAYEFTTGGSPAVEVDAAGNKVELTWDSNFNNTQVKDGRGLSSTMTVGFSAPVPKHQLSTSSGTEFGSTCLGTLGAGSPAISDIR